MHRSKSKDRATAPGPAFMSSKQMANYLHDLRNNRIPRPNGSRPPPQQFASWSSRTTSQAVESPAVSPSSPPTANNSIPETASVPPRCSSAQSHNRTNSGMSLRESLAGRPLIPEPRLRDISTTTTDSSRTASIAYKENGHRQVEKEEARALRLALEVIDLEGEQGLYSAARDEAAELVWKHQNLDAPSVDPNAPYQYPGLTRTSSHKRSRSLGRTSRDLQRSNSKTRNRNSTGSTTSAGSRSSSRNSKRVPSDPAMGTLKEGSSEDSIDNTVTDVRGRQSLKDTEIESKLSSNPPFSISDPKHRRRSSGAKRNTSGSLFRNPDDQIYEEPEEEQPPAPEPILNKAPTTLPLQVRRNPFTRVQFAKEGLIRSNTDPTVTMTRFDRFEIQKNPPTQSRNAAYTSNSLPTEPLKPVEKANTRDVVEEIKMKDGKEIRSDDIRAATSMKLKDRSPKLPTPTLVSDSPGRPIVSFKKDDVKPKEIELKQEQSTLPPITDGLPPRPDPAGRPFAKAATLPVIPTINFPDENGARNQKTSPPIPSISISPTPPIPTINVKTAPPPPTINVQQPPSITRSTRPLPTPRANPGRPVPHSVGTAPPPTRSHWSPAAPPRTGALCSQCALPIAGRIVSAAGSRFHPECFVCHYCGEGLECVAFYPEPENARAIRIDRIRRRQAGEDIEIGEGISEADDGDESMRFYCHLDYHEFFSPRCKSCKTPIEGEVIVACGAEWHAGHFFCAQCGDPFDSTTPFVEKDGYAWCVGCHTNRYSTKCKKCRKPVTDMVLKALGAEWHAQCFCCMVCLRPLPHLILRKRNSKSNELEQQECGGQFDDGRYFLRGNSQDPVCVRCEERRLKA
ncbi:uncharacterized protein BDZ99DRAFT_556816 [Mytilinidion resinicola]|uniref:LIM zinc-binding domain-containing protein n=1 Tax=Mytilinidion resinicola TaxID=574789 RepID=A0A6A6YZC5_9PEZI|nr:uncharacterized protein BDZ99DRAFT_556816 [Mytilinidion resinicola]KAF2813307.1 hypothetical protein BDZ99DRAFT_556816 [Mytilinidion resinicola]